jgi:hypothetical protein
MYKPQRGEKGKYPDNDADDTKTHPDYVFHLDLSWSALSKGAPDTRNRRHEEVRRTYRPRYGLPQPPVGPRQSA